MDPDENMPVAMRILVICFSYPPYNSMGALRVDKTASALLRMGHDVRVVTADKQPLERTLPLSLPRERVHYTHWINVNGPAEVALGGRRLVAKQGYEPRGPLRKLMSQMPGIYRALINVPDGQVGWFPFAAWEAARLCRTWKPDLILASGLPVTAYFAAALVARLYRIPWVAELRDLWGDNHYLDYSFMRWRRSLDQWLERRILGTAAGFVTVSEPLAEVLRGKYRAPVRVIENGLDPEDYPARPQSRTPGPLRIAYTGTIVKGRDPGPLFRALRALGPDAERFRVSFYGRYMESVRVLAAEHQVEHVIEIHEPVSYHESLAVQASSDVLLLLLWNHPQEHGVFTGKLFQYLGARRPILVLGPQHSVAAQLVKERAAGVVLQDAEAIEHQLRQWLRSQDAQGELESLPADVARGLSRREAVAKLDDFMHQVLGSQPVPLS